MYGVDENSVIDSYLFLGRILQREIHQPENVEPSTIRGEVIDQSDNIVEEGVSYASETLDMNLEKMLWRWQFEDLGDLDLMYAPMQLILSTQEEPDTDLAPYIPPTEILRSEHFRSVAIRWLIDTTITVKSKPGSFYYGPR